MGTRITMETIKNKVDTTACTLPYLARCFTTEPPVTCRPKALGNRNSGNHGKIRIT
ncbi:hypothetical protein SAMN03080615_04113 [Amphritea atlantica]|uniref:Uncharacterized protein n=1 Tax=Amphritea atlantica TaxID=355243 RepID=A0A1H9LW86_9GAMM|nr:hypothetical protein SAMN03080615_04113 [Amphritea atlantica]